MTINCIACGMPMVEEKDFANNDMSKDYCCFCCRKDGSMQSYDEKLASMSAFIKKTQNVDDFAASQIAKNRMEQLPAWR